MTARIIKNNTTLAGQIKSRRNELGLTIEECATRAGVGTKTWSRYEAGESIRQDKYKGVCRALNWRVFPENADDEEGIRIADYKKHEAWSSFLEGKYGERAALSFAIGSDLLYDKIDQDLEELAHLPMGTHIGQLSISWICDDLPQQFLMFYNYDFLYNMRCTLQRLIRCAKNGYSMQAHTVIEELILYLCVQETNFHIEIVGGIKDSNDEVDDYDSAEWLYDMVGDNDIVYYLFNDEYLEAGHSYHFSRWNERQFWMKEKEEGLIRST